MLSIPALTAGQNMVTDPTTGLIVTAPQYGETLTIGRSWLAEHPDARFNGARSTHYIGLVNEKLGIGDWGIDRNEFDFKSIYQPLSVLRGTLAESWEQPDPLTYIFSIRRGVYWHDKSPMDGRELTTHDIEYNFHRYLGLGSGFTEFSFHISDLKSSIESVIAVDRRTVVFKLNKPDPNALEKIVDSWVTWIYPPEVIELYGDIKDWRNLVGTGPYELEDFVESESLTWIKNSNYWANDEKYPENRLPYVDEIKALIIPKVETRLAAMSSGRIDILGNAGDSYLKSINEVKRLVKNNPEFQIWPFAYRSENSFAININHPPFDDIKVRQAMQMALDLENINNTYFSGYGEWQPMGLIGPAWIDAYNPFETWPDEVKKTYIYDLEGAKTLLAEAGYPDGFETVLDHNITRWDTSYRELAAKYWSDIGVRVEINPIDNTYYSNTVREKKAENLIDFVSMGADYEDLDMLLSAYTTGFYNPGGISDPTYDRMVENIFNATDAEEQRKLAKEADMYAIKQHWFIWGPRVQLFQVSQPWVKGFNGELSLGKGNYGAVLARLWINQDLKNR